MKKYFIGLFIVFLILSTTGAVCSKSGTMPNPIVLQYWSVNLNPEDVQTAIKAFEATYPYVTIQFKKLNADEYEDALLAGWAKSQGPDIFSLPNTHIKKYYDYIQPLPSAVTVTTVTQTSTLGKKETKIAQINQKSLTPAELRNQFVDTVYNDAVFMQQGKTDKAETAKIFGIPLSMDTLALYWNKDLLNQKTITLPASNWQTIADDTKELTAVDKQGNIIRSGIALGTADNVPHYFDIMSVLMMQFGAQMTDSQGTVSFQQGIDDNNKTPAQDALDFYAKFAQNKWETYTWNDTKNNALEEFANGNLAYFIGYHSDLASIKKLAPSLNFDVAPLPQINSADQINYPQYWLETVSTNATNSDMAWAFVQYLTNETNTKSYIDAVKSPAARRTLVTNQLEDYELATFAEQALTAKSWYHGQNPQEAINLFKKMIDNARAGTFTLEDIIGDTAAKIQLTINP